MKPKTRILLLLIGLILPYMVFVLYFASRSPLEPLPKWFPYVAACYFLGSIFLFPFLRKRVLAGSAPQSAEERKVQSISAARAARRMGYI
jgi:RsiW-degrading membrane proteinase PrsW (M82 family)